MNRRKFLQSGSLAAAATALTGNVSAINSQKKKKSFKAAFLSDVHVKPDAVAEAGMRKAFKHVNSLEKKPLFIINGGDSIMDALAADKIKTQQQWDVWNKILAEENTLPMYHCIGNHDVWGWQVKDDTVKTDSLYAKAWVLQQHKMPGRYYSFTKNNWHFIVLDSAQENNGGYIALLDEPQFNWLQTELENNKEKFICIVSHIPIVSFCSALFFKDMLPNGDWKLSRALLHTDARKLKDLFKKYPAVKTCISGHIHLQDEVEYLGVTYYCNGAVSGNWWHGAFQDFEPAYALFDFFDDGTVQRQMLQY